MQSLYRFTGLYLQPDVTMLNGFFIYEQSIISKENFLYIYQKWQNMIEHQRIFIFHPVLNGDGNTWLAQTFDFTFRERWPELRNLRFSNKISCFKICAVTKFLPSNISWFGANHRQYRNSFHLLIIYLILSHLVDFSIAMESICVLVTISYS